MRSNNTSEGRLQVVVKRVQSLQRVIENPVQRFELAHRHHRNRTAGIGRGRYRNIVYVNVYVGQFSNSWRLKVEPARMNVKRKFLVPHYGRQEDRVSRQHFEVVGTARSRMKAVKVFEAYKLSILRYRTRFSRAAITVVIK